MLSKKLLLGWGTIDAVVRGTIGAGVGGTTGDDIVGKTCAKLRC